MIPIRNFVAGTGGAIEGRLLPQLLENKHEVVGLVRTEGTNHLLAAAREVGARPFVAQS